MCLIVVYLWKPFQKLNFSQNTYSGTGTFHDYIFFKLGIHIPDILLYQKSCYSDLLFQKISWYFWIQCWRLLHKIEFSTIQIIQQLITWPSGWHWLRLIRKLAKWGRTHWKYAKCNWPVGCCLLKQGY